MILILFFIPALLYIAALAYGLLWVRREERRWEEME